MRRTVTDWGALVVTARLAALFFRRFVIFQSRHRINAKMLKRLSRGMSVVQALTHSNVDHYTAPDCITFSFPVPTIQFSRPRICVTPAYVYFQFIMMYSFSGCSFIDSPPLLSRDVRCDFFVWGSIIIFSRRTTLWRYACRSAPSWGERS